MFMMTDTSRTASMAGLVRATATASAMSMAKPQPSRFLPEIEADDGDTGRLYFGYLTINFDDIRWIFGIFSIKAIGRTT
jgi:hypothetical protein